MLLFRKHQLNIFCVILCHCLVHPTTSLALVATGNPVPAYLTLGAS